MAEIVFGIAIGGLIATGFFLWGFHYGMYSGRMDEIDRVNDDLEKLESRVLNEENEQ